MNNTKLNIIKKCLTLFCLVLCSNSVQAKNLLLKPKSKSLDAKSYEIEFRGTNFSTASLYNTKGEEVELPEGSSFSMTDLDINVGYAFSKKITFLLGSRFRMVSSEDEVDSLSNSGIESVWGGLQYYFNPKGKWIFSLRGLYRFTAYTNEIYAVNDVIPKEIVLGDDGKEYRVGLVSSYKKSKRHFFDFIFDYVAPPNDLSSELQYDLSSTWRGKTWGLGLGVEGIFALGDDPYESEPENKPIMATGSTNLFNSINRTMLMPYAKVYYAFKNWRLGFQGGQVVKGASTDKGMKLGVSILWNSQGVSTSQVKSRKFKEYLVEADVIKISPRRKFVKIDHGVSSDVEKGMPFDIYQTDFFGGNKLVATGVVYQLGADWSIVKIVKRYRKIEIKKGFAAKGY